MTTEVTSLSPAPRKMTEQCSQRSTKQQVLFTDGDGTVKALRINTNGTTRRG